MEDRNSLGEMCLKTIAIFAIPFHVGNSTFILRKLKIWLLFIYQACIYINATNKNK